MSTVFDFTYTLNSETTQNEVLYNSTTTAAKVEYGPTSHFFVDESKLSSTVAANYTTDAFGPVTGSLTTKYRTTSKIRATGTDPVKVMAICNGQVLIQPQTGDATKVNLILKPSDTYAPLKIKYFIYRGVNKADLIGNNILKPVVNNDPNQPIFLNKLWTQYIAFNTSLKDPGTGQNFPLPNEFPSFLIGYDETQSDNTLIENYFTKKDINISYQIPLCKAGEHLGNFTGEIGLDIVLDHGDYQLQNQEELFKLDLKFAREKEHVFDTATIPSSTPVKVKRYKEYIHQFMDAAAFWGSHMECGNIKTIATEIAKTAGLTKNDDIFSKIVNKYQTQNKIYLYIQAENNRSYNYYDTTRKVYGFSTAGQLNTSSGWPIIIEELTVTVSNPPKYRKALAFNLEYNIHVCDGTFTTDTSVSPNKHIANIVIPEYERHVSIDIISPKNNTSLYPYIERPISQEGFISEKMQFEIPDNATISGALPSGLNHQLKPGFIFGTPTVAGLSSIKVVANSKVQNINFIINSTSAPLIEYLTGKTKQIDITFQINGTKSCASFLMLYGNLKQEFPLKNYYNDLFPVNLTTNFLLPTTETENMSSWVTYDKSRMVNLDDILSVGASIQNKLVFDNGKGAAVSGVAPRKTRRLYMAILKRNSDHNTEYNNLNIDTITSGIAKTTTTQDQYALNLYNDLDFSVYKGTFNDGSNILNSLTLIHNNDLSKKNSYFHFGITNEEYNKLVHGQTTIPVVTPPAIVPQFLPTDADNVYFHLEEISTFTTQNVQKFKVGMRFEDNTGAIVTLFPLPANDVFVYTIDGNYFFSKEYAEFHEFFEEYPKAKADFRVKLPYAGEFGFDWMRVGDTIAAGDVDYKNHVGKLYKDPAYKIIENDINKDTGNFVKISKMYKKFELEYKPIPIQWEVNNNVDKYYVPMLTIYPPYIPSIAPAIDLDRQPIYVAPYNDDLNRVAKLTLNLKITVVPTKIELVYDQTLLEITSSTTPIVIPTSLGNSTLDIYIKCLKEIGVEQQIKVVGYYGTSGKPQTLGILKVNPNVKSKRFSKKVALITVKTNLNGTIKVPVANDKALFLKQFLRQILITPVIKSVELDMTVGPASATLNSNYMHFDNVSHPLNPQNVLVTSNATIPNFIPLYDFLLSQNAPGTTIPISTFYNGYYILFFFSDDGGSLNTSHVYHGLNGLSQPTKNTMLVFASANDATATHEFIHTANLPHSFSAYEASKFAKFTYEPHFTDNILDYSHKVSINRVSLWNWQGKIAKQASEIEP
ncbi:hypothetical protein OIU80_05555 [Flavobacterium sp. LS1R47]|uniref:Uncharacterized protein n=1 Tax=Flavobacterium frigoritolerans TaxID=2987686 RepID=A0A9X2ZNA0_9FLAO|nr:hypothetical protein [Flavobacterium frigoritolerans]MCV9931742.1 hypothetical protein [Flavobacterium frigoritolerans]